MLGLFNQLTFSKAWIIYNLFRIDGDIDNLVNEIRFSVFERPALRIWREDLDKKFFIEKLVEYNIPFFEEDHDGLTWFLYDYYDSEIIVEIEREIGLFDSLFSKLPDTQ